MSTTSWPAGSRFSSTLNSPKSTDIASTPITLFAPARTLLIGTEKATRSWPVDVLR